MDAFMFWILPLALTGLVVGVLVYFWLTVDN